MARGRRQPVRQSRRERWGSCGCSASTGCGWPSAGSSSRPGRYRAVAPATSTPPTPPPTRRARGPSGIRSCTDAKADGIALELRPAGRGAVVGDRPRRATRRAGPISTGTRLRKEFEAFARAVATRYSGNYDPGTEKLDPGNPTDLPRVSFWSVWNEPDYGPGLAPQGVPGHLKVENSPRMYRNLVDSGVERAAGGPATDPTTRSLWASWRRAGALNWGVFSGMKPLIFLRALYCVDSQLPSAARRRGRRIRGCPDERGRPRGGSAPRTRACSRPAASPTTRTCAGIRPTQRAVPRPELHVLGEIGNLTRALDRLQRVYGSHKRFPIYNTEFGYITTPAQARHHEERRGSSRPPPPTTSTGPSTSRWQQPAHPLVLAVPALRPAAPRGPDRLRRLRQRAADIRNARPKATYAAWRLPLYLPVTTARRGTQPRGLGMRAPGALRPDRHGRHADRADPVPARVARAVQDASDGRGHRSRRVLRPAHEVPGQRHRAACLGPTPWPTRLLGYFDPTTAAHGVQPLGSDHLALSPAAAVILRR